MSPISQVDGSRFRIVGVDGRRSVGEVQVKDMEPQFGSSVLLSVTTC